MVREGAKVDAAFLEEFLAKLADAGNALDARAAVALCTEDVRFEDGGPERAARGRELIEELFGGLFGLMARMHFEVVGVPLLSADNETVAARWHVTGVTHDGVAVEFETVDFYRFSDGLVSEYTIFVRDPDWLGRLTP